MRDERPTRMEIGCARVFDDAVESRVGAEQGGEGVGMDKEGSVVYVLDWFGRWYESAGKE